MSFSDNKEKRRFEWTTPEGISFLEYRLSLGADKISLVHTQVPAELQGQGVAGLLVGAALDYVRKSGWKVVPLCPYVRKFIQKHPEYQDLVEDLNETLF